MMIKALRTNTGLLSWLLLITLSIIWGSSFILIKKSLSVFSAGQVGAIRILSACLVLLPISLPAIKRINKDHLKVLFASGLVGSFGPAFLFATAQTQLNSSVTGILNALTPLFVLVLGGLFFQQVLNRKNMLAIFIGFTGSAFLIFSNNSGNFLQGVNLFSLLVVLATLCYGTNLNLIKKYLADLRPQLITSVSLLLVGPFAAFYLFGMSDFHDRFQIIQPVILALSYVVLLGVVGTAFALILFNKLVQISSPLFTSTVTYLIPVVAVMWGMLDGERITSLHFLGMVIIIFSVYMINHGLRDSPN